MIAVNPKYKPEDRKTLTQRIAQEATNMRSKMKLILKGLKISITTDSWTSGARDSYFSMTCQWIDNNWKMRTMVLACEYFTGTHRAQDINQMIDACLKRYEIQVISFIIITLLTFRSNQILSVVSQTTSPLTT
jgi:hypothetical protein